MKRCMARVSVLLLTSILVSCGGGGGDSSGGGTGPSAANGGGNLPAGNPPAGNPPAGNPPADNPPADNPPAGTPPSGGGTTSAPVTTRFEETNAAVSMSAGWTKLDSNNSIAGWSGGTAVQSTVAGATVLFTFTGTSVRWIGSRGRGMGKALVSVDGGPAKEVDLFARPNDELRTPIITFYELGEGQHTLTIEVTGGVVVVDAFDVQPQIVSHYQDADPDLTYSGTWTVDTRFGWSGSGAGNPGDPPVGAHFAETANAKATLKFRGTGITWSGYRGPDAGIASVQVDGGQPVTVDTYADKVKVQEAVFTVAGLTDTDHTLTITAKGEKRGASTGTKIFVDAFDVTTPGRRYEDPDLSVISYSGSWILHNDARVWSEGSTRTSNRATATATFKFIGTSVSWIGASKASAGGTAKIFLDGVFKTEVKLGRRVGIEGYQRTIFRQDGLTNGSHELMIEVTSTDNAYVVVDAFDVHPEPVN
jgi:hypothetical protein